MPPEADVLRRGAEAFAELGYDGASVRELARRMRVSHNFVNDRYGSKDRFWRAVVDAVMAEDLAERTAIALPDDDLERLRIVITQFNLQAARHPYLNAIMTDEFTRDTDRLDYVHEQYVAPTLALVEPSIERLVAAGRMRPMPMHVLYFAVIGPAAGLTQTAFAHRLGRPESANLDEVARTLAETVLSGLVPGSGLLPKAN